LGTPPGSTRKQYSAAEAVAAAAAAATLGEKSFIKVSLTSWCARERKREKERESGIL
jgi:hypothetical protein